MTKDLNGIHVPKDVQTVFNQIRSEDQVRWIKFEIAEEKIATSTMKMKTESFEDDFNSIQSYIETNKCAYFLIRLNEKNQFGDQWLLIWYVPDTAKAKEKMIYSTSIANLKKDLGDQIIKADMHTSLSTELSYSEWISHEKKR